MNDRQPERRESTVDLVADDIRVRAGFRVVTGELLAGGPIELEFFVESRGECRLNLAVSSDRMRQRPGQLSFEAAFEDSPLADPLAAVPYLGGPVGVVPISAGSPWHQPLLLNQFIRLEGTVDCLVQGATGRMVLECRRPLVLARMRAAALAQERGPVVDVELAVDLRRDDAALAALVARFFDEVMEGPAASRERPLAKLLSMRSVARVQIDALTHHPDPSVAERARQSAESLGGDMRGRQ